MMCHWLYLFFLLSNLQFISSFFAHTSTHMCPHDQSIALLEFKNTFSIQQYAASSICDYYGVSYPKTESWKEGVDCCTWDGVSCDIITGQVIGLDLSCSRLEGTLSSNNSLFLLTHLQHLNLAFNDFSNSRIPPEFGRFKSLTHLNLSFSWFSGQVPSEISYLSSLISLDLSLSFDLELEAPALRKFVQNFTIIQELRLYYVNMSSVSASYLVNLSSSLTSLDLRECGLQGEFPENILYLPKLQSLALSAREGLTIVLPKSNWSTPLRNLELRHMPFTGRFPKAINNLLSLEHLTLWNCSLTGLIDASIWNLTQLRSLNLGFNNLSEIPSSLTNLTQLEFLSLRHNLLLGSSSIPNLSNLSKLVVLDLGFNFLNGTIPSWLYTLPSLHTLYLHNNQFTGPIGEFEHKSLEVLILRNNKLHGFVPRSIFDFVNLISLDLSSNNLSGLIELDMFSKLSNLRSLDLSYNNLLVTNNIKYNYSLPKLTYLSLASCNLTEFPNFLGGSKYMDNLDLSNNRIRGQVPQWMWEVGRESMYYLNLSHNHLTDIGKLPWKSLEFLDIQSNMLQGPLLVPQFNIVVFLISNNKLSGEIPHLICNASGIEILNLSQNRLSGTIPECIGNFSRNLEVLDLSRNTFHGKIPKSFADGSILKTLNFNGNRFEGILSRSIANCKMLEVLDLGNNKINDTFPHWLLTLQELKVVILRSNRFHGPIHDHENNPLLPISLQIFDIANNAFSGPLPTNYIKNLKAMMDTGDGTNSLQYVGGATVGSYYQDSVSVCMKGLEYKLVKIISTFKTIDFSNNKFEGDIPEVIGKLTALKGLNISNNMIGGHIRSSLGNLTGLEWLDLSFNKLIGEIPGELTSLTFLAKLNLSNNKLEGPIPKGKQFNTFDNSSYEGNLGLCGFPLSMTCGNDDENTQSPPLASLLNEEDDNASGFDWKIVAMGYGTGLVIGLSIGYIEAYDAIRELSDPDLQDRFICSMILQ
ncbi:receptor-like protein 6 [Tripterygium wilfordii]|uniref:receptor-like protein 6 n=1 Tax=Tripterygium wilfordii TaxID=458696 RepID=UPI0018F804B1|nr:receptor-like protein 6 [Tripterygium wilfordii]